MEITEHVLFLSYIQISPVFEKSMAEKEKKNSAMN